MFIDLIYICQIIVRSDNIVGYFNAADIILSFSHISSSSSHSIEIEISWSRIKLILSNVLDPVLTNCSATLLFVHLQPIIAWLLFI